VDYDHRSLGPPLCVAAYRDVLLVATAGGRGRPPRLGEFDASGTLPYLSLSRPLSILI